MCRASSGEILVDQAFELRIERRFRSVQRQNLGRVGRRQPSLASLPGLPAQEHEDQSAADQEGGRRHEIGGEPDPLGLGRAQDLIAREVISQDVLDDLRFAHQRAVAELGAGDSALATAQRALRDTRVLAPFSGTAEVIHVQEGDYLTPGSPVALITDFSRARLRAGVTAADAALIDTTQQATLGFEALGGARLWGSIHSVSRIKDPSSGTYPVEIWLDAADAARLREGMVAAVQLPYTTEAAQPTIPKSALFRKNGELRVFTVVDDIAVVRSMVTDQFNHAPAQLLMQTGSPRLGSASMGSWVTYGLGSESRDLPGFVVLASGGRVCRPHHRRRQHAAGECGARHSRAAAA
ncbi:MAG: efflux RND transporter periplasmic adaptor subunit [Myxococcales bacterium]|nr:efflux RND transporter periplasmic adaptor subunit [Myxococcales bacterium]